VTLKELLVSGWYRLLYRKFDGDDLLLLYRRGEDLQGDDLHTWPEFIFCRFDVHTQLNSDCGFVLIDKLEQMDVETMMEFGKWAESEGLQIIATRVSTGEECSIVIEDGEAK